MTSPAFSSAERLRPESTHPIGGGANSPYSGKPKLPKPEQIRQCAVMLAIPTCVARPHRPLGAIPPAARTYDYDRQHTPSVDCRAHSDLERISSFTPRTAARRDRRRNHAYDGGNGLPALPNAEPGETKNLPRYSARTARPTPRRRHSPSPQRYSYDRRQDYDPLRSLPDCIKRPSRPHHARAHSILRSYDATCRWFVAPNRVEDNPGSVPSVKFTSYKDGLDARTAALLKGMNGNSSFVKQVGLMNTQALQTAKQGPLVLRNGKRETDDYRREAGFAGYHVQKTGELKFDSVIMRSDLYQRYGRASMDIPTVGGPGVDSFVIHAHSFSPSTSSDADIRSTRDGDYIFTLMPANGTAEIVLPGGASGYTGTINEMFPGLK